MVKVVCYFCGEKYETDTLAGVENKLCSACVPKTKELAEIIRDYVRNTPGVSIGQVCIEFGVKRQFVMNMVKDESLQAFEGN